MSTEYTFDGLDEWEKNLAQIIDRQYPEEFKQMVIDIAEQALGKAKELTPVQTGRLRDAWNLGTIEKRGDTYYIEIYNNVEYAEPVEYGHRMKGGGFKKRRSYVGGVSAGNGSEASRLLAGLVG